MPNCRKCCMEIRMKSCLCRRTIQSQNIIFGTVFGPFFTYLTESANHVRLQEVSLTYTLPAHYMRRIGMSSLQVYGMANNVCSIYANKWNEDPEFPRGSVKPAPYFTFGVRIGL